MGRFRVIAANGDVVRSVGISAIAIAVAAYAMVLQPGGVGLVALGCTIVLMAATAVLQVGRAVRHMHRRQDEAKRTAQRAERHYFKVLRRIVEAFEAREPYCRGRSRRISFLAGKIAGLMGLDGPRCRLLAMAAQVQDIGLLAVPDRILNKPSRLGGEEYRTVKKHPDTSYRILEPLSFMAGVLEAVRCHHERMNGTGYPFGKAGEEIPMEARILAVAEAYEAMTHDRPHRAALPSVEALSELRRCSPKGYDSDCVTALEEVLNVRDLRRAHRQPLPATARTDPALTLSK